MPHLRTDNKCQRCFVRADLCFCLEIETFSNRTPVSMIVHNSEMHLASNTARLAQLTLQQSRLLVRGKMDDRLDESLILNPDRENFFLYPTPDAQVLDTEFARAHPEAHIIIPDGNWDGTRKVKNRIKCLWSVPAVCIKPDFAGRSHMRHPPGPGFLCTIEAIGYALKFWEGEEVQRACERNLDRLQLRVLSLRDGGKKLRDLEAIGKWPPPWMNNKMNTNEKI